MIKVKYVAGASALAESASVSTNVSRRLDSAWCYLYRFKTLPDFYRISSVSLWLRVSGWEC
ncbi:hypothetical protein H6F63_13770 [Trichocoleus sp. FACHB-40]|nr:hypothetical protein [Trichocoleus sp. FACHB-40]